jgi:hypothetical protein
MRLVNVHIRNCIKYKEEETIHIEACIMQRKSPNSTQENIN